jgi:hypothetical protein
LSSVELRFSKSDLVHSRRNLFEFLFELFTPTLRNNQKIR